MIYTFKDLTFIHFKEKTHSVTSHSKSSDVDDSDMPKRSLRVLRLSEKVCTHRKKQSIYRVPSVGFLEHNPHR